VEPVFKNERYIQSLYDREKRPKSEYPSLLAAELLRRTALQSIGSFVDIGCGRGDFLHAFAPYCKRLTGIDLAPNLSQYIDPHTALSADLDKDVLPIASNSIDFVFSKSVIEHLRNPLHLLGEIRRILKSDGVAVIMTPSWEAAGGMRAFFLDHTHVTPFTRFSLSNALDLAGYSSVKVDYFIQLPIIWRFPYIKPLISIIGALPINYYPMDPFQNNGKINKVVRFSKELMLLAIVRKGVA
jgi:SAM-dependent methyltransferase